MDINTNGPINAIKDDEENEDETKKGQQKSCEITPCSVLTDFTTNTGLHGFQYLSKSLSLIENIFWTITIIISIAMCSLLIKDVWHKWQSSPVIVTFNENAVPVWKVPFPAVTICPELKCKRSVYNYSQESYNYTHKYIFSFSGTYKKERDMFDDITTVCQKDTLIPFFMREIANSSLVEHIRMVAPDIESLTSTCKWRKKYKTCRKIFQEVLTHEGVCFTFNTLSENEMFNFESIQRDYRYLKTNHSSNGWSMENGYSYINASHEDLYPLPGRDNGAIADIDMLLLDNISDHDPLCNGINIGYKVYVHHPADMPQSSLYSYAILPEQMTALAVKFDMVSTSDAVKKYPPEKRQCYFPTDRKLKYFRYYTQSNCELECVSNYTYSKCGCVWFHMPHNNSTEICTSAQIDCVEDAKEEVQNMEIEASKSSERGNNVDVACNCMPSCDSVAYDAEVLKTGIDYKNYYHNIFNMLPSMNGSETNNIDAITSFNYSRLVVYFKEPRFISRRRSELFGTTDFLANCGGLLGLFLGFSFLSLIEILYFPTLRVCCLFRRKRRTSKED